MPARTTSDPLSAERTHLTHDCFQYLALPEPTIPTATRESPAQCPADECLP
jgi:hypothetical protein